MFRRPLAPLFLLTCTVLGACDTSKPTPYEPPAVDPSIGSRPAAATGGGTGPWNTPHPFVGKWINIVSVAQSAPLLCLDIGGAAVSGTDLIQTTCSGATSQKWIVVQAPTTPNRTDRGLVFLQSAANASLCLDLEFGTVSGGERLQVFTCHGGANQTFRLPRPVPGPGSVTPARGEIRTENSGFTMLLDVALPLTLGYVQQLWPNGGANQKWRFFDVIAGRWI